MTIGRDLRGRALNDNQYLVNLRLAVMVPGALLFIVREAENFEGVVE